MNNELKDHLTHKCQQELVNQPLDYEKAPETETTPIVEIHHEYCHGIYVVLGLLIGIIIGFCFGVAR